MEPGSKESLSIDLNSFDEISNNFYDVSDIGEAARATTNRLQEQPEFWLQAHIFFQQTNNLRSKYIALTIFTAGVKREWNILQQSKKDELKKYYFNVVMDLSSQQCDPSLQSSANAALMEILKNEWPSDWLTFIQDLISASKQNSNTCMNNLDILSALSNEIREVPDENLSSDRLSELTSALDSQFQLIFEYLESIFADSKSDAVKSKALSTLSHYLKWADLRLILHGPIIQQMANDLLPLPIYRIPVLSCFIAIANHRSVSASQEMSQLFDLIVHSLSPLLSEENSVAQISEDGELSFAIIQTLTSFILLDSCGLMQGPPSHESLWALAWTLQFTGYSGDSCFLACMEMWSVIARQFIFESQKMQLPDDFISSLQFTICSRMVRPPDFCLVCEGDTVSYVSSSENDDGNGGPDLYAVMKSALTFLTQFRPQNVLANLKELISDPFSLNQLPLIYCVGAISGAIPPNDESTFISEILSHFESQIPGDYSFSNSGSVIVAASFAYIASQYSRVLYKNFSLLKKSIQKCFDFCGQPIAPLQQIAVGSLRLIAQHHYNRIVSAQSGESSPLLSIWFENLPKLSSQLPFDAIPPLFESATILLSKVAPCPLKLQFIEELYSIPARSFDDAIGHLSAESIMDDEYFKRISVSIEVLSRIAGIGDASFCERLESVIQKTVPIYEFYGSQISSSPHFNFCVAAKNRILSLFVSFISAYPRSKVVNEIVGLILRDFTSTPPEFQCHGILDCFTALISQIGPESQDIISDLISNVVDPTSVVLRTDLSSFPELRTSFFYLLAAVLTKVYKTIQSFELPFFSRMLSTILWGVSHPLQTICDESLSCISELISSVDSNDDASFQSMFYDNFFIEIVIELFKILLDGCHKFAFSHLTQVIYHMFQLVQAGRVTLSGVEFPIDHIAKKLCECLMETIPRLDESEAANFSQSIVNPSTNNQQFRQQLRDFLIYLRRASPKDSDLYKGDKAKPAEDSEQLPIQSSTTEPAFFDEANQLMEF